MASLDLGTLKVGVKVEGADKAKTDLKVLSGSFSGASKGGKGLMDSLKGALNPTSLLSGAIGGLTASLTTLVIDGLKNALVALWEFGKQSIQVASDLQESANVVEVVFGKENKVAKWAEESASAFNLSALEAQKFAGTMGAVLTPTNLGKENVEQMSMVLTQMSGDLGSLWNTSSEQAFTALRGAMSGETEGMKQFGVVMTQANLEAYALSNGIDKSFKSMNQAEQATLRYNFILANTKTAQGDAIRTADGYANSTKGLQLAMQDASNALGQGFLPGLSKMKQGLADFISSNKDTIAFIGNVLGLAVNILVEGFRTLYAVIKPVIFVLNALFKEINPIINGINELFGILFDGILGSGKKTASGVAYEMVDMAKVSKNAMGEAAEGMEDSFEEASKGIKGELDSVKDALKQYYDEEEKKYKESLEKRYGNSKGGLLKQAEMMNRFREQQNNDYERDLEMQTKKLEAEEKKRADIRSRYSQGNSGSGYTSNRNANGTLSARGGWTTVGETGRELMYVQGGSKIINNNTTEKILGGNGTTITGPITVVANNVEQFIEEIKMYMMSGGVIA